MKNKIYTITTIKFGMREIPVCPNKGKRIFTILDQRTVGWFPDLKTAKRCVEKNWGDIYENGEYPWAVIERFPAGLYPCGVGKGQREWWYYCWNRLLGYEKTEKPEEYKRVFNYAMG